MVARHLFKQSR
uniref:Uncharacterized protein n=1 Tax=Rhizophora mucronata TaxID=61149 RepID=A0A2P2QVN7_RHIMU